MNKKILFSLGIIAALALYLIISGRNWHSGPDMVWKDSPDEMIITKGESVVTLQKKDTKWLIGTEAFPADESSVESILAKMKDLEVVDLVSEKGYLEKYGLVPEKYTEVQIKKDGAVFRRIHFGKKSPTNRHTFITLDSGKAVYLASGVFDALLNKTVDQLRDKTIIKISRDAVSSFKVTYKGRSFVFEKKQAEQAPVEDTVAKDNDKEEKPKKKEDVWVCRGFEKVALDGKKVGQFLSALDPLKAAGFPDMKKEKLGRPSTVVTINAFNAETELRIYDNNADKKYVASSSASPYVFTLDEWKARKFFIDSLESFKNK
ncbi:MAG TPA: DUF4340 domain-containing protein [Spirochaetota bacterium]|nr:DUF4340 domain-containing protein [Spirochaetota bacterium]HPI91296.1 DUF4340 domain-containing protein [Spirochaetota bacterium]HPR48194.1 DUF4340 domain-containing protein [Spirochaetota bacterium]